MSIHLGKGQEGGEYPFRRGVSMHLGEGQVGVSIHLGVG